MMRSKQILVVMLGALAMSLGQHATAAIDFSPASITVQESDGAVTLTIVRTGAATEAADVTVVSTHGSATVNVDYTFSTTALTWAADETGSKTITVPIQLDAV